MLIKLYQIEIINMLYGEKQMNETKKVNEISSKKNFGKYSKKIHRRNDKAITLIALAISTKCV